MRMFATKWGSLGEKGTQLYDARCMGLWFDRRKFCSDHFGECEAGILEDPGGFDWG